LAQDIYSDPELYDAAHWWKTNDLDFMAHWADTVGDPVLELAAGTGRLAVPILERGHHYTGLEQSAAYVTWAKQKLAPFHPRGQMIQGDMRDFHLGRRFQFIFIGFNSFLHLYTEEDIQACLACVREHLSDSGRFLIDIFVPNPLFLFREEGKKVYVMEFEHPSKGPCTVDETNIYDPETQINHLNWYFHYTREGLTEEYEFDMHILYPDTMDRVLTEAGFIIHQKLGDYEGHPMNANSSLQIYVCGLAPTR